MVWFCAVVCLTGTTNYLYNAGQHWPKHKAALVATSRDCLAESWEVVRGYICAILQHSPDGNGYMWNGLLLISPN